MTDRIRHVLAACPRGGRLDAVLAVEFPLSRSRLKALVLEGRVTVDGEVVCSPRHKLRGGERVVLEEPPPPPSGLVAQDLGIPVRHLDDHVVVVNKAADMVVHPAKGHAEGTLVNGLLHLISEARCSDGAYGTPPSRPGIVHRLDRGTSGLLVVARTPAALTHLAAQFAAHTVDRAYVALVWGEPRTHQGTVDAPLGRHPKDRKRMAVCTDGKRAVTHWTRVAAFRYAIPGDPTGGVLTLVRCVLETGRTHQIRVHMHHIGLPLVGDPVYGRKRPVPGPLRATLAGVDRQLLHAGRLGFEHPLGQRLTFEEGPPEDFRRVLEALDLPVPFVGASVD